MHVIVEDRFNGPPGSGHGGMSAGLAAGLIDGPAEVTLRRPPPLGTPLAVRYDEDGGVTLRDRDVLVMEAQPAEVVVETPDPVGLDEAAAASERFPLRDHHPFPTCFGCGPARDDGLGLFCGPVGDGRFAVPWTPPGWTGSDGVVDPVFVWAALDCPSAGPVHGLSGGRVVLGRFAVAQEARVTVGEPHVIQSWLESRGGRAHVCGVALFDAAGRRVAAGRATWVELAEQPVG